MKPSFFSLFKRGRYFRSALRLIEDEEAGGDAVASERQQAERFIAATIAFCFKYDRDFQLHFWQKVCKVSGDPDAPATPEIQIEEAIGARRQADIIISAGGSRPTVHVVECKYGARLAPHQNPDDPAFWKDGGYGKRILSIQRPKRAALRYVVLGAREDLTWRRNYNKKGIHFIQRQWCDLSDGCPETTSIICDLIESLGAMGLPGFRMKRARKHEVTADLSSAAKANEVLSAVLEEFGLRQERHLISGSFSDDERWHLGVYVRASEGKKSAGKLPGIIRRLTGTSDGRVWYGYMGQGNGATQRCIYVYCGNSRKKAESIANKVKASKRLRDLKLKATAIEDGGPEWQCVTIEGGRRSSVKDVEWFTDIIEALFGGRVG